RATAGTATTRPTIAVTARGSTRAVTTATTTTATTRAARSGTARVTVATRGSTGRGNSTRLRIVKDSCAATRKAIAARTKTAAAGGGNRRLWIVDGGLR